MYNSVFRNIHTLLAVVLWVILAINAAKRVKITTTLETLRWCEHPDPPYPNPMMIFNKLQINTDRGQAVVGGKIAVYAEIPVNNVSFRIYSKSGNNSRDKVHFEVRGAKCHNLFVKTFLKMVAIPSDERLCTISKGNYTFHGFSMSRLTRVGPTWLQEGLYMVETRLCTSSHTLYCQEFHIRNDKE